jgi:Ca2+-binding RTX toxin-like protein
MASALFGSFLAHEFVPAQTHEGAVAGQLFGAIGSAAGISAALSGALGTVLGFIVPGLGSLLGTILGTLIGDAFGNVPHPAATDLLDQAGTLYAATHYQVSASDGGDYSTPDQMVVPALAIINAYLGAVKGAALDHSKQVTLGYQANPVFYIDGVPGHPAIGTYLYPNAAVQDAALAVLQNTEVIGGDLLMKRAHQNSSSNHAPAPAPVDPNSNGDPGPTGSAVVVSAAEQLAVMSGDLGVAQDYENYLNNREAINALMAANPDSAFTAGWIATFARVNELGLNHTNASDFLGGLVGYLDLVSKAGLGAEAVNVSVKQSGGSNVTVEVRIANGVDVPGALSAFADQTSVTSDATGTTVQFVFANAMTAGGFHPFPSNWTAGDGGNDLWFGNPGAANSFAGTGGHDILVGGAAADVIHGGAGWDFIDGGAGNDTLFGDDGNDILRGGTGADNLQAGAGNDSFLFARGERRSRNRTPIQKTSI